RVTVRCSIASWARALASSPWTQTRRPDRASTATKIMHSSRRWRTAGRPTRARGTSELRLRAVRLMSAPLVAHAGVAGGLVVDLGGRDRVLGGDLVQLGIARGLLGGGGLPHHRAGLEVDVGRSGHGHHPDLPGLPLELLRSAQALIGL